MSVRNKILENLSSIDEARDAAWSDFENILKSDYSNKFLKQMCDKYGYDCDYIYRTSIGMVKINVYAKDRSHSSYYPSIYVEQDNLKAKPKFKIQTTSFGGLEEAEYAKFLKACDSAYNLVHVLNNYKWDKLPVAPDK